MALLQVLMNYFVAKGRVKFSYAMSLGAMSEIGVILLFHGSLFYVIYSLLGVGGFVLSIGFVMLLLENRSEYSKIRKIEVKVAISEK